MTETIMISLPIYHKSTIDHNIITQNDGNVLLNETITAYEDLAGNQSPSHMLIIEWADRETAENFRQANLVTVDKKEAFYTHFAFPEEE